jgi:hypothetical protein
MNAYTDLAAPSTGRQMFLKTFHDMVGSHLRATAEFLESKLSYLMAVMVVVLMMMMMMIIVVVVVVEKMKD